MSRLGGQFAGILRVAVPGENELPLVAALKKLESRGLTVVVHADQPKPTATPTRQRVLDIVGQDRPGIVREISRALASFGVDQDGPHIAQQPDGLFGLCRQASSANELVQRDIRQHSISCEQHERGAETEFIAGCRGWLHG